MQTRDGSSSVSTWARRLMALVFVAAMIGVCAFLLRRDTWRRDQPPPLLECPEVHEGDLTPPRVSQIDEMTQLTECFAAFQGDGAQKHLLALRPQPLTAGMIQTTT